MSTEPTNPQLPPNPGDPSPFPKDPPQPAERVEPKGLSEDPQLPEKDDI